MKASAISFRSLSLGCAPLDVIVRGRPILEMGPGTHLFRRGEPSLRAFVLVDGLAALSLEGPTGGKSIIHLIRPGECLGVAAVLCAQGYPVGAETLLTSRLVALPAADLLNWLRAEPANAPRLIALIAQRYGQLLDTLVEFKVLTPRARLCRHLLSMAEQDGAPRDGAYGFRLPLPAHVVGRMAGLVPESTSRVFAVLAAEGIRLRGGWVSVADMRRLRALAGEPSGRRSGRPARPPEDAPG